MKRDENCVFCKIINNELPSYKVYEDEEFSGFLTTRPHVKGHMLLIPKNHSEDILSMESAEYQKLMAVGKTMAEKVKNIFNPKRVTFMIVGLEVAHTHLHIFPINSVDNLDTKTAYDATIEELAEVQSLYLS